MPLRLKGDTPRPGETDRRYYMLDVQEGNRRVRLSTGTRDKQLALRKEQAVIDALRENPTIPDGDLRMLVRGSQIAARASLHRAKTGPTIKEACDAALNDRNGWGRLVTRDTYATNCRMIQIELGEDFPIEKIDQAVVDDLCERFEKHGNSTTTINRKMFALFTVLRRERKSGRYARDIPEFRKHNERDARRTFHLSRDDEAALFTEMLLLDVKPPGPVIGHPRKLDAAQYHDLFVFLVDVGCRLSQAFKVRWRDIIEEDGRMFVCFWRTGEQKGGRPRTTPCSDRVAHILRRLSAQRGKKEGPFSDLVKRRAQHIWDAAKAKTHLANEKEAVIHSLRHTCATRLLRLTGDLKLVQDWLGHTTIDTTGDIYAHVMTGAKVDAVRLMDKAAGVGSVPQEGEIHDRKYPETGMTNQVRH